MVDYVNINKILQKAASLDENGESKSEIDTKREYDYLGNFLNGSSITEGYRGEISYNYADLSKEDKKTLLDKMKSLAKKFGPWENKFDSKQSFNLDTASVYLERYRQFQEKLLSFENEKDRAKYYDNIKDELADVEINLKSFCKKYNIEIELLPENCEQIQCKFNKLEPDIKTQEFLKNYNQDFKLTIDNAYEYSEFLESITDSDYTPSVISSESNKKAVDILKKSFIEFLQPLSDEKLNDDNILTDVRYRTNDALWKADKLQNEKDIKLFLNDNFDLSKQNIGRLCEISNFVGEYSTGTLSVDELKQAKTKINDIWNKYASEYLTEEDISHLSQYGLQTNIADRIINENDGTYKKYEAKISEVLHKGDDFKITNENADSFIKVFEYLCQKKLASSSLTDEEFTKANNLLTNSYLEYLKQFDDEDYPWKAEDIKNCDLKRSVKDVIMLSAKTDHLKQCGNIIQQCIDKPYDNMILQKRVNQYIKDNNIPKLNNVPNGIDVGNGKFDKISTQHSENCWAHAGINSLLTTKEGRKLIESNYYRDEETGVIAIHIQEADNIGLHDGIFYVTPQEIIDAQDTVASGEGEITAYIIAFQKYFNEVMSDSDLKNKLGENRIFSEPEYGNVGFRVYELMTGGQYTEFKPEDCIKNEDKISKGIGISTSFDAKTLYKMLENKEGAVTISLRGMEHNISIIGVKDGKFLIQESNNDEHVFDGILNIKKERVFSIEEFVDGRPTFGITIEDLDQYDLGAINYIKFK